MTEQLRPQGEQPQPKKVRKFGRREKAEAKRRIANLTQAAAELTDALGMPREDMFDVLHMVYSDRFQPQAGEAVGEQAGKEVFSSETAKNKNTSQNNPKH